MFLAANRLRRHAEYQQVYRAGRKNSARQMSYFFRLREPQASHTRNTPASSHPNAASHPAGPRVGLTVGRVLGKAVDRNHIKRRLRAAVRAHIGLLHAPVDVVLHPHRRVAEIDFALLTDDVRHIFRTIQQSAEKQLARTETSS